MVSGIRIGMLALCVGTTSCAIPPVVEQTHGFTAAEIVRKVRCEARDAIEDKLAFYLRDQADDPYAQAVYRPLLEDRMTIRSVEFERLKPGVRAYVDYFMGAALAYDFTLNITEKNDANADVGLAAGSFSIGIKSGVQKTRNHTQSFSMTDTFLGLSKGIEDRYCDPKVMRPGFFNDRANHMYPLAGRIGIKKPLDEFVDLVLFSPLTGKLPGITSSLEFTTKVQGDATPKVVATPALTAGSIGFLNSREDKHKVTLSFSAPPPPDFEIEEDASTFVPVAGTPAERRAASTLNRFIERNEMGKVTVIIDNR